MLNNIDSDDVLTILFNIYLSHILKGDTRWIETDTEICFDCLCLDANLWLFFQAVLGVM